MCNELTVWMGQSMIKVLAGLGSAKTFFLAQMLPGSEVSCIRTLIL